MFFKGYFNCNLLFKKVKNGLKPVTGYKKKVILNREVVTLKIRKWCLTKKRLSKKIKEQFLTKKR